MGLRSSRIQTASGGLTAQCDPRFDSPGVTGTLEEWVAFARSVVAVARDAEVKLAEAQAMLRLVLDGINGEGYWPPHGEWVAVNDTDEALADLAKRVAPPAEEVQDGAA